MIIPNISGILEEEILGFSDKEAVKIIKKILKTTNKMLKVKKKHY